MGSGMNPTEGRKFLLHLPKSGFGKGELCQTERFGIQTEIWDSAPGTGDSRWVPGESRLLQPLPRESLTQEGAEGQGGADESSGASHPAEPLRARGDGDPGGDTEGSGGVSQPQVFHGL